MSVLHDLPDNFDLIHIAPSVSFEFSKKSKVNKSFFNIVRRFFSCTAAYIVSKQGAKKLLAITKDSVNVPADDLLSNAFIRNQIDVIVPESPVFTYSKEYASTIHTA